MLVGCYAASVRTLCNVHVVYCILNVILLFCLLFKFYIIIEIPTHRINYLFINIQDVKLIEVLATFHNPACVEIIILL